MSDDRKLALFALVNFRAAYNYLVEVLQMVTEDEIHQAVATGYPPYLPSFDEIDFNEWVAAALEHLGHSLCYQPEEFML
jgi:hypothetical protein